MIACNRGESGSPDAGAGRRRRARERYAISGLRSATRGMGSSGRFLRQRPDPLAGVEEGGQRFGPAAQTNDQLAGVRLTTRPGRPIRWKRSAFMRLAAHTLAQRETLHRGVYD